MNHQEATAKDAEPMTHLESVIIGVLRELADQSANCNGRECVGHPVESMVAYEGHLMAFHCSAPEALAGAVAAGIELWADTAMARISAEH